MRLHNEFAVKAPIDQVWAALMDLHRGAGCVPGAQVLEKVSPDCYLLGMRVKLGPISMQYRGQIDVVARDEASRTAILRGTAKETRGQGTAQATIELALTEKDSRTHGTVDTDVRLSGRAAAMGQGVIASVTDQVLGRFAHNLEVMLKEPQPSQPDAEDPGQSERSGENVVEALETLAAGTQSQGVLTSCEDAKSRRAPVEQVRGDEDMTEGQVTRPDDDGPGGPASSDAASEGIRPSGAPVYSGVSGVAQSLAAGRVSDRVFAEGRPSPASPVGGGRHAQDEHGASLDGLAVARGLIADGLREHRGLVGLLGVATTAGYLLGRARGCRR